MLSGLLGSNQAEPAQVAAANSGSQGRGFFGNLFSSNKEPAAPQPSTNPTTTAALQPAKPAQARTQTATLASPKTRSAEPRRPEPQETTATAAIRPRPPAPAPQQEANAAAPPAQTGTISGAQPVLPSGNFDSRWGGLQ